MDESSPPSTDSATILTGEKKSPELQVFQSLISQFQADPVNTSRYWSPSELYATDRIMNKDKRTGNISPYPSVPHGSRGEQRPGPWEIAITGDLSADRQADTFAQLVDVPIGSHGILYFDSSGGSVYAGLSLATLIRARELNATAVVMGECSSAALMPFAACRQRFVTSVSTLLFHPMRWQSEEDVRLEEATEWARHFKQLETDLDDLLIRLFPVDADLLARWSRPGRFVSGTELAAAGLAELFDPFLSEKPFRTIRSPRPGTTPRNSEPSGNQP